MPTSKITNNLNLVFESKSVLWINYFIVAGSKEPIASLSVNESFQLMEPGEILSSAERNYIVPSRFFLHSEASKYLYKTFIVFCNNNKLLNISEIPKVKL